MARTCATCHQSDHHRPDCPEMFWPDGRRRGIPGDDVRPARGEVIQARRVEVFVPTSIAADPGPAKTRAGTFAYLGCGMATPVVETVTATPGGHSVVLVEMGDVAARGAAAQEKR